MAARADVARHPHLQHRRPEQFESATLGTLTIALIGLVPVLLLHRAVAGGRAGS